MSAHSARSRGLIVLIAGFILACAVFAAVLLIAFLSFTSVKNSPPYLMARTRLMESSSLAEQLGAPVATGWYAEGEIRSDGLQGTARLSFPVSGSHACGETSAQATQRDGQWNLDYLAVTLSGQNRRMVLRRPAEPDKGQSGTATSPAPKTAPSDTALKPASSNAGLVQTFGFENKMGCAMNCPAGWQVQRPALHVAQFSGPQGTDAASIEVSLQSLAHQSEGGSFGSCEEVVSAAKQNWTTNSTNLRMIGEGALTYRTANGAAQGRQVLAEYQLKGEGALVTREWLIVVAYPKEPGFVCWSFRAPAARYATYEALARDLLKSLKLSESPSTAPTAPTPTPVAQTPQAPIVTEPTGQPAQPELPAVCEVPEWACQIRHPANWKIDRSLAGFVTLTGAIGTPEARVQVVLQSISSEAGPDVTKVVEAIQQGLAQRRRDFRSLDRKPVSYDAAGQKIDGLQVLMEYSTANEVGTMRYRVWQIVLPRGVGKGYLSCLYRAPLDAYEQHLPLATAMFETWRVGM